MVNTGLLTSLCALGSLISVRNLYFHSFFFIPFESVLILIKYFWWWWWWFVLGSRWWPNINLCYILLLHRSSYVSISLQSKNPHLTITHQKNLVYTNSLLATLNIRKSIIRPTSSGSFIGVGGGGGGVGIGNGGIGSRMVVDRKLSLRDLPSSSPISPHVRYIHFNVFLYVLVLTTLFFFHENVYSVQIYLSKSIPFKNCMERRFIMMNIMGWVTCLLLLLSILSGYSYYKCTVNRKSRINF